MNKNKATYIAVALIFVLAGAYVAMHRTTPAPAAEAAVGRMLAQSLPDSSGQMQSLSRFKGQPLVVNFWATWCAPCVDEMPELSALHAELQRKGINIIGIGIDSPANITEFAVKYKIVYPLYVGGMSASELARQLGNQAGGLPFTILVDRNGQVKKSYLGRLKMDQLRLDVQALSS
jgi:peroxiredoxin